MTGWLLVVAFGADATFVGEAATRLAAVGDASPAVDGGMVDVASDVGVGGGPDVVVAGTGTSVDGIDEEVGIGVVATLGATVAGGVADGRLGADVWVGATGLEAGEVTGPQAASRIAATTIVTLIVAGIPILNGPGP